MLESNIKNKIQTSPYQTEISRNRMNIGSGFSKILTSLNNENELDQLIKISRNQSPSQKVLNLDFSKTLDNSSKKMSFPSLKSFESGSYIQFKKKIKCNHLNTQFNGKTNIKK